MKEATGELNMTVITIVAIAAIVAFFYIFVYPGIRDSIKLNQACNDPATYTGTADDAGEDEPICNNLGSSTGAGSRSQWTCEVNGRTKECTTDR